MDTSGGNADAMLSENIDVALGRLAERDREAVILRFFEDLDYSDIAAQLQVSEPAARKRVSRALKQLRTLLGTEIVQRGTLATLMVTPPVALLSMPTPPLASVQSGQALPFISLIMTKKLTITVALIGCGTALYLGSNLWQENQRLKKQLATTEMTVNARALDQADLSDNAAILELLQSSLEEERSKRSEAEAALAALEEATAGLDEEIVVSYGKLEEVGANFGSVFSEALALVKLDQQGGLDSDDGRKRLNAFTDSARSLTGLSQDIVGFEDDPDEGSRFFSSVYKSVFDLDESTEATVASLMKDHFEQMQKQN